MGSGIARRLARAGVDVVVWNRTIERAQALSAETARVSAAESLDDLVQRLDPPRCLWLMLPSGSPTEEVLAALAPRLARGDLIVDGGNAFYQDSVRRGEELAERGIELLDVGTSGGVWGEAEGYCLMVGGSERSVARLEPVFAALAPANGWRRVGPCGAGHFVKMVHNGIEYGLLQAYAEGFAILEAKGVFSLDLAEIASLWQSGSVVRSWLLELAAGALRRDAALHDVAPWVDDSGEGRWTVAEAIEGGVPTPVITLSLLARLASRDKEQYAARFVAALRREFGGHDVRSDPTPR